MRLLFFALALFSVSVQADEWTYADTYRETAFQVLHVIDWGQTRYIAEHPDYGINQSGKYHEVDSAWLIGKNPSVIDVDRLMLATAILHPIISYYIPRGWREAFQYLTIGMKLNNVIGNASIGIKVEF